MNNKGGIDMTKEEAIENIKLIRFNATITNAKSFKDALDMAIEALSKPSLPSNLDEAAEKYQSDVHALDSTPIGTAKDAFIAGAEWMAGRGIKLHGRILPGPKGNPYIESDCFDKGLGGLNYSFRDSNYVDIFVFRKKH